jgi:hypothetical protein
MDRQARAGDTVLQFKVETRKISGGIQTLTWWLGVGGRRRGKDDRKQNTLALLVSEKGKYRDKRNKT